MGLGIIISSKLQIIQNIFLLANLIENLENCAGDFR